MEYSDLNQYQQVAYERIVDYICRNLNDNDKEPMIDLLDMLVDEMLDGKTTSKK